MAEFDVAIVGAGAGGALAAAMLGRAGHRTCLIDPARQVGSQFRCEKLEAAHIGALRRAGLLAEIAAQGERYDTIWIARQGRLVERRPRTEYGFDYAQLVTALRGAVPETVARIADQVTAVTPGAEASTLALSEGRTLSARLVVLATGLQPALAESMGMTRRVVSASHSLSIGFDVAPVGRAHFDFEALTYFGEHPEHRVSYITFFPLHDRIRANLFVYRDRGDPWLDRLRSDPVAAIHEVLPRLRRLTGEFAVLDTPRMRPVDLVDTVGLDKPGVVLIGDAFSTACPVSGTGAAKALVDAERLCNGFVADWLRQPEITAADVARFYVDPEKVASDQFSRNLSLSAKRLALEPSLAWEAYRWVRFAGSIGRNAVSALRHPHGSHRVARS
ncbi:FAD-dependent oxidoreductase [Phreatobacter cathodiphilus]|uniref:2-polyprenyl-6-methoxyphenol hydroxylase n=1 Tax=Phreatobacter cathodiphilus TaxID=1868589 RepID=A0A2S0NCG3_9HYPH|nr:FAD-dependent monooxygenase [Phreatobacter cathodiphilus]AVO45848.1 2-polyprenyl-6-methoxyphenol hydroxylase [Phreatobacter cathodiphilus]